MWIKHLLKKRKNIIQFFREHSPWWLPADNKTLNWHIDRLVYHKQSKKTKAAWLFALFNMNKQKRRASFNKSIEKGELCIQIQHKQTETNSFVYKTKINKQKQTALFTKPK